VGESQFRRGDIHYGTLYLYTYVLCAVDHLQGFSLEILWSENKFIDFGKLIQVMSELRLIYLNAELVGRVNTGEDTKFHRLYNKNYNSVI
jgi:hypothetical protein